MDNFATHVLIINWTDKDQAQGIVDSFPPDQKHKIQKQVDDLFYEYDDQIESIAHCTKEN